MKVAAVKDEKLLSLIGDSATFELGFKTLMQLYQEKIYWHVRRMVLDHDDANDVVQNVFIKVYRAIGKFEGNSKIYTWLYRIASNEAITFIKRKKRKSTDSIDNELASVGDQLKADAYFDGDEAQIILQEAIQQLPDRQKLVFNMRYFDGMPYQDISDALDTTVGGLKASYHHAVKKIENYIKNSERII